MLLPTVVALKFLSDSKAKPSSCAGMYNNPVCRVERHRLPVMTATGRGYCRESLAGLIVTRRRESQSVGRS